MFSVVRVTSGWIRCAGREVGRGSVDAVPGTPLAVAAPAAVLGPLRADHHAARRVEDLLALLAAR